MLGACVRLSVQQAASSKQQATKYATDDNQQAKRNKKNKIVNIL